MFARCFAVFDTELQLLTKKEFRSCLSWLLAYRAIFQNKFVRTRAYCGLQRLTILINEAAVNLFLVGIKVSVQKDKVISSIFS